MRTRRRYVLIQLILVGLCFVSLLFSMFRENVVIRQVIQRYELPYLGTTLLRTIDGKPVQGLAHEIRTFEDSNIPFQIGTQFDWVDVTSGYSHNIAQKVDGAFW